jgi:alpha-beta hydrolase superfamily lysophospholipase
MGFIKQKIFFTNSRRQELAGVLFDVSGRNKKIAVFCHGYRSTKESSKVLPLAEKLALFGISLFAFDFSGRGESEGKFEDTTITQYIDDLKSAIDYCSKLTGRIIVVGNSLGGLVALEEAVLDKRPKALVLMSPASSFPWRVTKEFSDIDGWKLRGHAFTFSERFGEMKINYSFYEDGLKYGNCNDYKKISVPVLILHGTSDKSVPVDSSKKLSQCLPDCRLMLLKDADHNYSAGKDFDRAIDESTKFIVEQMEK